MRIKEKLQHIIKKSLITLDINKKTNEIVIESSKENNLEYYTNIAISLAKDLHKKPEEIAEMLKNIIKDELISNIEVIYPGTLNILLNKNYVLNGISEIIEKNINYGKSNIGSSRKINIDFINDYLSDDLELNSIFNAIYGDNLSRILKYNGFDITKEYYLNDTSNEIDILTEISIKKYQDICKSNNNLNINIPEKKNIRDTAFDIYNLYGESKLNEKKEYFKKEEISTLLDNKKHELDRYRINFNTYTSEQLLYDKGLIDTILDKLNRKGYTYFHEDELWLKTTDFNDEKDRKLIQSDGTYTYVLPLIAYHVDRLNRNYDGLINIYNINKLDYKKVIKPILKMLEQDISNKIEIKILPEIKEEMNQSNLNIKDINSIRFLFSMQNIKENININLEKISKMNKDNPIYNVENINIKINKILKNYNKKIVKVSNYRTIKNKQAYTMINKLYEFEDIVIISGLKQMPHLICNYLLELIDIFDEYYSSEQIVNEDEIYTNERLNLLLAIKIVINNAFNLIGIIPREEI